MDEMHTKVYALVQSLVQKPEQMLGLCPAQPIFGGELGIV